MAFDPEKITYFAKTDARGQPVSFGIKAKDRQRHMYVIGKTGMGKSTLLENMAAQDIQNGEGMAFIDPHGSAAETLLEYIPEERVNDVIYFAPFDLNNPISFNVMEDVGPDKRHLVVSGLMSTFKKIWVDAWSARMEYILTNALLALIEYPDTTLLSVNRLFTDKKYRQEVVDYITDPAVKSFWVDEFANYTDRFAAEALPAIQNKIGQFTGNPLIRNIIGQPKSSFDIRDIMDNKKILIMNLSKGLIGETNANLLGSMLTTRIYLAAMSRADLSVEQMRKMPNFYFYVDEFQSFANATFADILSEARKYHLNLIIAHQYIEQMEEEVRDAVFGNVGTTIAFRVGPFDAEVLETVFTPTFLAADLINLGFAQIYLSLMIDGIGSAPFSATTLPPLSPPSISYKQMAILASRKNYTRPRAYVEELVNLLHNPERPEKSNNKRPDEKRRPDNRPRESGAREESSRAGNSQDKDTRLSQRNERPQKNERSSAARDERATTPQNNRTAREDSGMDSKKPSAEWRNSAKRDNSRSETKRPESPRESDDLKNILRQLTADEQRKSNPGAPTKKAAESKSLQAALAVLQATEKSNETKNEVGDDSEAQNSKQSERVTKVEKNRSKTGSRDAGASLATNLAMTDHASMAKLEVLLEEAEKALEALEVAKRNSEARQSKAPSQQAVRKILSGQNPETI